MDKKLVFLTGAAGRIGSTLRWPGLEEWYRLRVLYHRTVPPDAGAGGEVVVHGSVVSLEDMLKATQGVDAIVHLALIREGGYTTFRQVQANMPSISNIYEAARQNGVRKVVYASTNNVTGVYEQEGIYTTPDMPPRPDSFYGVGKAFGEILGRYYADHYDMSVICIRIGSHRPRPMIPRQLATWLSPRDMLQLVHLSLQTEVKYGIYYGISGNTRRYWDISNAQEELGYQPQDDAETYAAQLLAQEGQ